MRIDEWSDTVHAFFPFRSRDARALAILNRDAVVAVAVPSATTGDADDPVPGTPVSHVAIDAGGALVLPSPA